MSVRNFSFVVLGVATLFVGACEGEIGDHTSAAGGALGWRWRYGRGGHGGTPSVAGNSGSVAGTGGSAQPTGIGGAGAGSQPTGVGGVGGTPTGTGNSAGGTAGTTGSGGTPTGAAGKGGSTSTGTGGAVTGAAGKGGTTGTGGAGAVTGAAGKGGTTGTGGVPSTGGVTGSGGSGAQGPGPIAGSTIFFSDLTSGPNTGGQNSAGAFVTVWGNGFGDARGTSTVTIGGGEASTYPIWTSTKITFQLGANAKSGDVVVHVAGKQASNALSFTVRSGNIFFVTATGSDSANGSFTSPWKTIPKAKNSIAAGDIAYIGVSAGDTVSQTTEDSSAAYRGALGMSNNGSNSGTAAAPKALVAYPGARATIGAESGLQRGIMVPSTGGSYDYWVISQFSLRGEVEALDFSGSATGWRVIGNDISCPNGTGKSGCVAGADQTNSPGSLSFFGNVVHDAGAKAGSITKYYHGVYFASNNLDIGWNTVRDGKTCRAIQFHNSTAANQFNIKVHDNVIHGTVCDGINFATIDPSKGAVVAYNNVIYDVGNGPDPSDGSSNYACVYVPNTTNVGTAGTGNVLLYNNTMYNCGGRKGSGSGAVVRGSGSIGIQMDDNLIVALSGETYISGTTSSMNGSNNLLSGAGSAPSFLSGSVASDPMFVGASAHDFHLSSGSPAVNAGKATAATMDIDGNPRPLGGSVDIGAYERTP